MCKECQAHRYLHGRPSLRTERRNQPLSVPYYPKQCFHYQKQSDSQWCHHKSSSLGNQGSLPYRCHQNPTVTIKPHHCLSDQWLKHCSLQPMT